MPMIASAIEIRAIRNAFPLISAPVSVRPRSTI